MVVQSPEVFLAEKTGVAKIEAFVSELILALALHHPRQVLFAKAVAVAAAVIVSSSPLQRHSVGWDHQ